MKQDTGSIILMITIWKIEANSHSPTTFYIERSENDEVKENQNSRIKTVCEENKRKHTGREEVVTLPIAIKQTERKILWELLETWLIN